MAEIYPPPPPRRKRSIWRIARRSLLIGGGATIGLALGWLAWPRDPLRGMALAEGETPLGAWLKIGTDGIVTVFNPQAEMGQGTHSSMAQLLADELGADWRTVRVEPAGINPAYANTAMVNAGAAAAPPMLREVVRWFGTKVMERFELQLTGGSTSIMAYEARMRLAGAAARDMLRKAAARRWGMDWEDTRTENGFVIGGTNRIAFAEIAADAANEDPPATPVLQPVKAIGESKPRLDIPAKVDGSARFGIDIRLPGQAYAAIRHAPPGVDARPLRIGHRPDGALALTQGPGWVALAAPTWWQAKTLLEGLEVEWPAPADPADDGSIERRLRAALEDAPPVEGSGRLVEATYSVPFLSHAALEPDNATARVEGGRAEVWAPTQSARMLRWNVAKALGLDESAVDIHPTLVGGGFGRKAECMAGVQAALIARDLGRPVQLIWSREEEFIGGPFRPAAVALMRARLAADGSIEAWDARVACGSVGQSFMRRNLPLLDPGDGPDAASIAGLDAPWYAMGARARSHINVKVPQRLGFWRSVEHSYTAFFVESFIDELAAAAGQDPLAYRLALLKDSPRHAAVLRAAGEAAGYAPGKGLGVALHESFRSIVAEIAEVEPGDEPKVRRVACAIDCGRAINPDQVRAQMEGSIIFGQSAALWGRVGFSGGTVETVNLDGYRLAHMVDSPAISVTILGNAGRAPGGVGEPGLPPIAPAIANALAAAGARPRALPIVRA